jgi:hypothetical protein
MQELITGLLECMRIVTVDLVVVELVTVTSSVGVNGERERYVVHNNTLPVFPVFLSPTLRRRGRYKDTTKM